MGQRRFPLGSREGQRFVTSDLNPAGPVMGLVGGGGLTTNEKSPAAATDRGQRMNEMHHSTSPPPPKCPAFATFVPSFQWRDFDSSVKCPGCGCEEVHFESVETNQNGRVAFVTGRRTVTHERGERTGRGSRITIVYRCEAGCRFAIVQAFHKGTVFAGTRVLGRQEFDAPWHELWRD